MESLSSAETPATAKRLSGKSCSCYGNNSESEPGGHHQPEEEQQHIRLNETLQQEVYNLKFDKLELLRQNVVSRFVLVLTLGFFI
jgi:hypothetical protein